MEEKKKRIAQGCWQNWLLILSTCDFRSISANEHSRATWPVSPPPCQLAGWCCEPTCLCTGVWGARTSSWKQIFAFFYILKLNWTLCLKNKTKNSWNKERSDEQIRAHATQHCICSSPGKVQKMYHGFWVPLIFSMSFKAWIPFELFDFWEHFNSSFLCF